MGTDQNLTEKGGEIKPVSAEKSVSRWMKNKYLNRWRNFYVASLTVCRRYHGFKSTGQNTSLGFFLFFFFWFFLSTTFRAKKHSWGEKEIQERERQTEGGGSEIEIRFWDGNNCLVCTQPLWKEINTSILEAHTQSKPYRPPSSRWTDGLCISVYACLRVYPCPYVCVCFLEVWSVSSGNTQLVNMRSAGPFSPNTNSLITHWPRVKQINCTAAAEEAAANITDWKRTECNFFFFFNKH